MHLCGVGSRLNRPNGNRPAVDVKFTPAIGINYYGFGPMAQMISESGAAVATAHPHPLGPTGTITEQHGQTGLGLIVTSLPGPTE